MQTTIIGVDPGRTTGLAIYDGAQWGLMQYDSGATTVYRVVRNAVENRQGCHGHVYVVVEQYVIGHRAQRSTDAAARRSALTIIGMLGALNVYEDVSVHTLPAGHVKPWATDKRLHASGVRWKHSTRHAADAARVALFFACQHGIVPDPLNKNARVAQ